MLLIDTDVVVDIDRHHPPALAWLASVKTVELALPGIVALELLHGARSPKAEQEINHFIDGFQIYCPTIDDHERARQLQAEARRTTGIGVLDMLIAQTVIGLDATLATFNVRHFARIDGLRIVQPYER